MMRRAAVALLFSTLALTGCDQILPQSSSRLVQRAERAEKEGDHRVAARLYEAALDGTADSAEVHYQLAMLYDDKLNNPIGALHHLQRYIEFAPNGSRAKNARQLIKSDEQKLLARLSPGAVMSQGDAARLKNENLKLESELVKLRAIPKVSPTPLPGAKKGDLQQKPIPPGSRTYTVKSGDTLASISRQFYKSDSRWKDIQDANFYSLEGTVKIKPGMTLLIPK